MVDLVAVKNQAVDFLEHNTGAVLAGAGIAAVGVAGTVAIAKAVGARKKRKSKRKSPKKKKGTSRRKKGRRRSLSGSYARTAGKRRDRSTKRIRMTKNGQPYVIMASGKARFISKRSAKNSRARKAGRY